MIEWEYTSSFKKKFKKLDKPIQKAVEKELEVIKEHPEEAAAKIGDLSGLHVHKFKVKSQLILIGYIFDEARGVYVAVGFHENFYRDLKR